MARRRLAEGLDGWCDPDRGEVFLAEGLTAAEEAQVLRKICARLMGGGADEHVVDLARELAVRPELRVIAGGGDPTDACRAG